MSSTQADSLEFSRVLAESRAIADGAGQQWSSVHLLLALFVVPNPVELMLRARKLSDDTFIRQLDNPNAEAVDAAAALVSRARQIARGTGPGATTALHLMVALANSRECAAHDLLSRAGVNTTELAREALSYAVGPLPRRFVPKEALENPSTRSALRRQPSYALASQPPPGRQRAESTLHRGDGVKSASSRLYSRPVLTPSSFPNKPTSWGKPATSAAATKRADLVEPTEQTGRSSSPSSRGDEASVFSRIPNFSESSKRPEFAGKSEFARKSEFSRNSEASRQSESPRQSQRSSPPRRGAQPSTIHSATGTHGPSKTSRPSSLYPAADAAKAARLKALQRIAEGFDSAEDEADFEDVNDEAKLSPQSSPSRNFELSVDEYPYLASLGRNLCQLAAEGGIDPVIGREREIEEVLDILGKRRSNNPILVGDPGVGKTAVVEGVARRLAADPDSERILIELDVAALVAGTHLRGSLSEKLTGIKDEVRRACGKVVVFIDEIHTLIGAGATGEGPQDAAGELKAALARGEFPCIGATTWAELQKYFVQDPALERRFVPVRVDEPSIPDAITIVRGIAPHYARHHRVDYDDEALEAAVSLSARYINDRALPDKALAALDHAGSRARREGEAVVSRKRIAQVIARMAGLPEDRLLLSDAERILGLEAELKSRVVGHEKVVKRVAAAVRRNFAGFSGRRPLASFIFLGPTGVGKTELARNLAEAVFGPDSLIRIDMSELSESHAVARLLGAPPGYVGFGEGGQLTEAVRRRPASVVLFDEIEKAHRDSQQILLQLLDEGHLSDSQGRKVDFSSTIVVLTSNLGAEAFSRSSGRSLGFGTQSESSENRAEQALELARSSFPPELWNRIEERLVFEALRREDLVHIARLLAKDSCSRLMAEKNISFELADEAIDHLLDNGGYDPTLGARPMRQALSRWVEAPLAEQILRGLVRSGDRLQVVVRGGKLDFEHLTVVLPSPMPHQASRS